MTQRVQPTKKRRWTVGFGPAVVPPNSTVTVQAQPQTLFRGEKLINTGDSTGLFIQGLFVGQINHPEIAVFRVATEAGPMDHEHARSFQQIERKLLVSPARPIEIMLAKIAPTVVLVLLLSACSFALVLRPAFLLPIRGSLALFFSVTALYVFAMTSLGIAIAIVARTLSYQRPGSRTVRTTAASG